MSFHDVIDNKDGYKNHRHSIQNRKSLKQWRLVQGKIWWGREKKGVKNEGNPRYVIENTYRKNVRLQPFHDVDENKTLTVSFHDIYENKGT